MEREDQKRKKQQNELYVVACKNNNKMRKLCFKKEGFFTSISICLITRKFEQNLKKKTKFE